MENVMVTNEVYAAAVEQQSKLAAELAKANERNERLVAALKDCARHPRKAQRENIVKKALAAAEAA
jgi:hypothetical protein